MSTDSLFSRFQRKLREFRRTCKGNVALTFGLAAIPIVCAVGAAVDYSHATSVKAALQSALDSTALMLQKETSTDTADQLQINAGIYFNALFKPMRPEAQNIVVKATYSDDGGSHVNIFASADVPTNFVGIMSSRFDFLTVSSSATSKWGTSRLRVALVLDNTGSMSADGKIDALKSATINLLGQLKSAAAEDGDVYVSIIPFSQDVKVGTYNSDWDSWMYWDDTAHTDNNSWDAQNGKCNKGSASDRAACLAQPSCSISSYLDQGSCTSNGVCSISTLTDKGTCQSTTGCTNPGETNKNDCTSDRACSNPAYTTKNNCQSNSGNWGRGTWGKGVWTIGAWLPAQWTPDAHTKWTSGCIMDRGGPSKPGTTANYDQNVDPPDTSSTASQMASMYPPDQSSNCPPAAIMGLNTDWDAMNTLVNGMTPNGSTNQPIGLVWGWLSLVGGGPLTAPATDSDHTFNPIIILLSDGLNTKDRWYGNGNDQSSDVDNRMSDSSGNGTCKNIKNALVDGAPVTIYTVQVNTHKPPDPTSTLLQNCASSTDKFFQVSAASQIGEVFQKIGTDITKLHLSQ